MLEHIEKALMKIIRSFMWEESTSLRIKLKYLHNKVKEEGSNLIDIKIRNEVIEIIWLKSYLNMTATRPTWAKIADIIIDTIAPPKYNTLARLNTFLQTWNPITRGPQANKMNRELQRMLQMAQIYNANFTAIKLSPNLKQKLLAWFQIDANDKLITSRAVKCLLNKHKVRMITDLMKILARIRDDNNELNHRLMSYCNCRDCMADHQKNCIHPYNCAKEALARINKTTPKSNPLN